MGWLNVTPEKQDKPRREQYTEGSPQLDLPFLSSYEQTLVGYWIETGQVTSLGTGLSPLTWTEIDAWANRFHTEQYVEWVEPPRPLRSDGLPDERFRSRPTPLLTTQCLLTDWELQMIKRMSSEYVSAYSDTNPNTPCPKEISLDDLTKDDKIANANVVTSELMKLFGNTPPAVEAVTST